MSESSGEAGRSDTARLPAEGEGVAALQKATKSEDGSEEEEDASEGVQKGTTPQAVDISPSGTVPRSADASPPGSAQRGGRESPAGGDGGGPGVPTGGGCCPGPSAHTAGNATWSRVCEALDALESRQAAARKELQVVREAVARSQDEAKAAEARWGAELAGLRTFKAASTVELQRQNRALAGRAARATRQSTRAASCCARACAVARRARAKEEDAVGQLRGIEALLEVRDSQSVRLQKRLSELERCLEGKSRTLTATRALALRQEALLDEVVALVHSG
uniref:Uncharacterized protein n=1 Tax=Pyrodinium bahamense TaxID=73915 RepID=A0A7R9ZYW4_9DINO